MSFSLVKNATLLKGSISSLKMKPSPAKLATLHNMGISLSLALIDVLDPDWKNNLYIERKSFLK
jgi:hypothetical protein